MLLTYFWAKYGHLFERLGSVAIRTLLPFASTYMCESGFSTLLHTKTKSRFMKVNCK